MGFAMAMFVHPQHPQRRPQHLGAHPQQRGPHPHLGPQPQELPHPEQQGEEQHRELQQDLTFKQAVVQLDWQHPQPPQPPHRGPSQSYPPQLLLDLLKAVSLEVVLVSTTVSTAVTFPSTGETVDSGASVDAGAPVDAGISVDSGAAVDSGISVAVGIG